jgi:hypothetical protein
MKGLPWFNNSGKPDNGITKEAIMVVTRENTIEYMTLGDLSAST